MPIVVPGPESDETRIVVEDATRKPKGLEKRACLRQRAFLIAYDGRVAELVVVDPLSDGARRRIDHEPDAPELVGDEPVRASPPDHVVRHILPRPIDEHGDDVARPIQLGDRMQRPLI